MSPGSSHVWSVIVRWLLLNATLGVLCGDLDAANRRSGQFFTHHFTAVIRSRLHSSSRSGSKCHDCVVFSRRIAARTLIALVLALPLALLAGCAASPDADPSTPEVEAPQEADAWVVVIFEDRPIEFDGNLMDALLETEMKADEALAEANAGWIDGNDVGAHSYDLYFVGSDVDAMWSALEPVFKEAPVAWTRVELRNGLEDPDPRVITAD